MQLIRAAVGAKADHSGRACPNCGRRYLEVFWKPKHQQPSYRCVGIGRDGGCGHEFDAR